MVQLSEAYNMLKYARALTWHLLPGFTWQIPEQFWNRTLKLVKKVLHYLQGMKGLMMTYRRSDSLHIVECSDSDYARDDRKSTSGYVFTLAKGSYFLEKLKANRQYIVHDV